MSSNVYLNECKESLQNFEKVVVAVDASDPDNLCLALAAHTYFGAEHVGVLLTSRCAESPETIARVKKQAREEAENDSFAAIRARFESLLPQAEWDQSYSEELARNMAGHFKQVSQLGNLGEMRIFDGGIPTTGAAITHFFHFDEVQYGIPANAPALQSRLALSEWLGSDKWLLLLGGPATGTVRLLEEFPRLWDSLAGMSGQFGTMGTVSTMVIPGRNPNVQFNVGMDKHAAVALINGVKERNLPILMTPTDLTRDDSLAINDLEELSSVISFETAFGKALFKDHRLWAESALFPRNEPIRCHDLATILAVIQLLEPGEKFFVIERSSLEIEAALTENGQPNIHFGETHFELSSPEPNCLVAVRPHDVPAYFKKITELLAH